jgi:hypothetical protein
MGIAVGWIKESWWVNFFENGILLNEKQDNNWVGGNVHAHTHTHTHKHTHTQTTDWFWCQQCYLCCVAELKKWSSRKRDVTIQGLPFTQTSGADWLSPQTWSSAVVMWVTLSTICRMWGRPSQFCQPSYGTSFHITLHDAHLETTTNYNNAQYKARNVHLRLSFNTELYCKDNVWSSYCGRGGG